MATQSKAVAPIEVVKTQLTSEKFRDVLKNALPQHLTVERFTRVALTVIQQDPGLLDCNRQSLFQSVTSAAQLGLLPDKQLGECYFVPYKGRVQMIPGYRGLVKLARQAGELSSIEAEIIGQNDEVEYILGDESKLTVKPAWGDRGKPVAVYAVAKFKDGGYQRVVMTVDQVEAIRKASPSGNSPAWKTSWEEMAKKTCVRRLLKMVPLSAEAATGVTISEQVEELGRPAIVNEHHEAITFDPESGEVLDGELVGPDDVPEFDE